MKITDVKTWAVANPPPHFGGPFWVFVKLTTDNGIVGDMDKSRDIAP